MPKFSIEKAREFLNSTGIFFGDFDDDEEDGEKWKQTINFNDVWAWACSDCEYVPDEELPQLAHLFWSYGWGGVLYWASKRNKGQRSAFYDNNRAIDFVAHEEALVEQEPSSSKRAYKKLKYTLGES